MPPKNPPPLLPLCERGKVGGDLNGYDTVVAVYLNPQIDLRVYEFKNLMQHFIPLLS